MIDRALTRLWYQPSKIWLIGEDARSGGDSILVIGTGDNKLAAIDSARRELRARLNDLDSDYRELTEPSSISPASATDPTLPAPSPGQSAPAPPSTPALMFSDGDGFATLTPDDIDQIVEGIEHFIIGGDRDVELQAIWQPYIDKLRALRSIISESGRMLAERAKAEGQ